MIDIRQRFALLKYGDGDVDVDAGERYDETMKIVVAIVMCDGWDGDVDASERYDDDNNGCHGDCNVLW